MFGHIIGGAMEHNFPEIISTLAGAMKEQYERPSCFRAPGVIRRQKQQIIDIQTYGFAEFELLKHLDTGEFRLVGF